MHPAVMLRLAAWLSVVVAATPDHGREEASNNQLMLDAAHRPMQQPLSSADDGTSRAIRDDSLPAAVSLEPLQQLRDALEVMQNTWFHIDAGNWPTGIDWTRAVVDTHLVATTASLSRLFAHNSSLDVPPPHLRQMENQINQYFAQHIAYYFGEHARALRYQAYDDMLWVVLGWLESVKFINAHSFHWNRPLNPEADIFPTTPWYGEQFISTFAHRARSFWELTTRGWDTKLCGGGMVWNPDLGPYKNAITNELFISASVGMYLYFPGDNKSSPFLDHGTHRADTAPVGRFDPQHLKAAQDGYDWLKKVGMMNKKGLYVDGFHISNWRNGGTKCDLRNDMVYTYNQGVLLSGLRGLWESTGNRSYLEDGHQLARDSIRATGWACEGEQPPDASEWAGLGRGGILADRCDNAGTCNQDGQTFKGIFMHHLTLLCEPLPLTPVAPGKTFAADRDLAFLHRQSCIQYSRWVAHNAKAALATRDADGKFGGSWIASIAGEVEPLPAGAIDYRNNASELADELWQITDQPKSRAVDSSRTFQNDILNTDPNDRGRGRTVETHSGGVAVLRALWELLKLE